MTCINERIQNIYKTFSAEVVGRRGGEAVSRDGVAGVSSRSFINLNTMQGNFGRLN